jgi:hypothetical protein
MPDSAGNFKGISVPDLPWVPTEEKPVDTEAWDKALGQAEQDEPTED